MMLRSVWAGHSGFVQRRAASSSMCDTGAPHEGHACGISNICASGACCTTATTSGMISPALRTRITSPMPTPSCRMKSSLCRIARETVVPASSTGSNTAVGVSTPVRPTETSIFSSFDSFSSGGYLKATAQRGNLFVLPNASRWAKSSTFTTAPSMSYGSVPRSAPMASISRSTSSILQKRACRGDTGNPSEAR